MTRFINILLVGLFGSYFYLEYQEPNAADAAQTETTALETAPNDAEKPVRVALATGDGTSMSDADPATDMVTAPENPALTSAELAAIIARTDASRRMATAPRVQDPEVPLSTVIVEEAPAPAPSPAVFTVTGTVVNARSGPGTAFGVVTRLRRGAQLFGTGDSEGSWARVIVSETGEEVWMHTGFIAESG